MAAKHPPVEINPGDIYQHDFVLGQLDSNGDHQPDDITGNTYSAEARADGVLVPNVTPTAAIEGAGVNGTVRVTVVSSETDDLLAAPGRVFMSLRNDTLEMTILRWEILQEGLE